jgi:hypothetical protein
VAANLIIFAGAALILSGLVRGRIWLPAFIAMDTYLLLNGVFLATAGVTNEAQGGALRIPLFVFVGLTVALMVTLAVRDLRSSAAATRQS